MKFSSSISAALIAATSFASYSLAAPLSSNTFVARKYDNSTTSSTATYTYTQPTAGATETATPANGYPSSVLYTAVPYTVATWNVAKQYIQAWAPEHPYVSTKTSNGGQDITVLTSFVIPDQYANNKCELVFDLNNYDAYTYAEGTRIGNIFSSLHQASYGKNNGRNQDIGEFHVNQGRNYGYNKPITFPCSAGTYGKLWNMEMVPQGDYTRIGWTGPADGLKVLVRPEVWN